MLTASGMLTALSEKLGKFELRRQIDELRRDPITGDIRMSAIAAIGVLYQQQMKELQND